MEMRDRFRDCAGLSATAIAERFEDDDLDQVATEILTMCAERTEPDLLPRLPFALHQTFYGETDVADLVIRYSDAGPTVTLGRPADGEVVETHMRWEHWEDAVRLLNGDLQPAALMYAFRITHDGQKEREPGPVQAVRSWLQAVNWANRPLVERPGSILARLTQVVFTDPSKVSEFVDSIGGLRALVLARARVSAENMVEVGAKEEVQGSYIRWDVPASPPISVRVNWAPDTAEASVSEPDPSIADDPEGGVTIRFRDADAFIGIASTAVLLPAAMADGRVTLAGSMERLVNFRKAMTYFARHVM